MWKPDYATVAELREYARISDDDDTVDDARMERDITAASRAVDEHCGRQFGKTEAAETRLYTVAFRTWGGTSGARSELDVDDVTELAGLEVAVNGTAVTPVRWAPLNAPQRGEPYTRLVLPGYLSGDTGAVAVTLDSWGWTTVPVAVRQATLLQALRLSKRPDSPFGVAGSPELGSELRLLSKVDPDVAVMLKPYVRRGSVW